MARPKLLLLDEPSMGLAPIFVEKIFEIVRRSTARDADPARRAERAHGARRRRSRVRARDREDRARRRRQGAQGQRTGEKDVPWRVLRPSRAKTHTQRERRRNIAVPSRRALGITIAALAAVIVVGSATAVPAGQAAGTMTSGARTSRIRPRSSTTGRSRRGGHRHRIGYRGHGRDGEVRQHRLRRDHRRAAGQECDAVISGMNDTPERRKQVAFVDYIRVGQSLMVSPATRAHHRPPVSLREDRFGRGRARTAPSWTRRQRS